MADPQQTACGRHGCEVLGEGDFRPPSAQASHHRDKEEDDDSPRIVFDELSHKESSA